MFTEAQNTAIVRTQLDEVFYQQFAHETALPMYAGADTSWIFQPINTTHAAYIGQVFKGVGMFSLTAETGAVAESTPRVTNTYTILVNDYTNSIALSKDLFDDNMHGVWAESVRQMALMARASMDSNAMGIFRGAFTTTLTPDGVSAINSAHPLIGGGTESNLVTGALSPSTLNDAVVRMASLKNQSGVLMGSNPDTLLVPPALWKKAVEVTGSVLAADTANNNVNVFLSPLGIRVFQSVYLGASAPGGSDTAWFLMSRLHGVRRLIRQGLQTGLRSWEYSNDRTYLYQANFRENYFVADYVGLVGSTGV